MLVSLQSVVPSIRCDSFQNRSHSCWKLSIVPYVPYPPSTSLILSLTSPPLAHFAPLYLLPVLSQIMSNPHFGLFSCSIISFDIFFPDFLNNSFPPSHFSSLLILSLVFSNHSTQKKSPQFVRSFTLLYFCMVLLSTWRILMSPQTKI